jgi:glycosyltransferase involved in cell wall biosynthesis
LVAPPDSADELSTALAEERDRLAQLYAELDARDRQIAKMRFGGNEDAEVLRLRAEILSLRSSTSWRVTEPLRNLKTAWVAWRRGLPMRATGRKLNAHTSTDAASSPATKPRSARRRVLVVDVRLPVPDIQSSGVRMAAIVRLLRELEFDVTLVSDHGAADYHWIFDHVGQQLRTRTAKLESQGVGVIFGYDAAVAHLATEGETYEFALVCLPDLMMRYAPAIRLHAPQATLVYDTVDLHALRYRRAAELSGDAEKFRQAERYDRLESANILAADRVVAISTAEAERILHRHPDAHVFTLPNIHETREPAPGFAGRKGLLFIGHYLHAPNEDAAVHLAREILPIVQASLGPVPLYLVGSSTGETIRNLSGPDVHVAGQVEDAVHYFDRCRVFAAPLRFGAGMKGKIGQSMSLGLPVVTTTVGAEGMDIQNGVTALIADEPKEFAAAVVRLYHDETLWNALSRQAQLHIEGRFSNAVAREALKELLCA